jgi:hypothetical protein
VNEPHDTEQSAAGEPASEENSGQENPSQDQGQQEQAPANSQDKVSEDIGNTEPGPPDEPQRTEADGGEDEGTDVLGTPPAPQKSRKALLLGLGSGALGLIVGLVIGIFAVPALFSGPGKPDGEASKAVSALASKNASQMGKVACQGPNGKPAVQPLPPQALQAIQSVKRTGPLQQPLDTEAQVPLSLTVINQGKPQTLPIAMVLGVTKGSWCMKGLAQPQQ